MPLAPPRTYEQLLAELGQHAQANAEVERRTIGTSVDGREIIALGVGTQASAQATVVVAGIHAMEHVGCEVALEVVRRAITGKRSWPGTLWVVPVCNPDGYCDVERGLSLRGGFWRENRRGVDLNRNFGVGFSGIGSLARHWGASDRGRAALSEPETRAVHQLLVSVKPSAFVSLHAFGNVIFTPHARTRRRARDASRHDRLAARMAAASGYRYRQLARYIPGFRAFGTELDHAHQLGALSFLIEIGAGPRPLTPSSWWPIYRWYTAPPHLLARDRARAVAAVEVLAERS